MSNNNMKDLFDRTTSSAEILNKQVEEDESIDSWDDFFDNLFAEPIDKPKNTQMLMRRSLPFGHPNNNTDYDLQIPYMFGFDDIYGERWLGHLFDTSESSVGWRFLLLKPDRELYLQYLSGDLDLMTVYESAEQLFIAAPNVDKTLIPVTFDDLPDSALPVDDSRYTINIWFDVDDLHFGMNVAHSTVIIDMAKNGRFYK